MGEERRVCVDRALDGGVERFDAVAVEVNERGGDGGVARVADGGREAADALLVLEVAEGVSLEANLVEVKDQGGTSRDRSFRSWMQHVGDGRLGEGEGTGGSREGVTRPSDGREQAA